MPRAPDWPLPLAAHDLQPRLRPGGSRQQQSTAQHGKSLKIKAAPSPGALLALPSCTLCPPAFLGAHTPLLLGPDHSSHRVHHLSFILCLNKARLDVQLAQKPRGPGSRYAAGLPGNRLFASHSHHGLRCPVLAGSGEQRRQRPKTKRAGERERGKEQRMKRQQEKWEPRAVRRRQKESEREDGRRAREGAHFASGLCC